MVERLAAPPGGGVGWRPALFPTASASRSQRILAEPFPNSVFGLLRDCCATAAHLLQANRFSPPLVLCAQRTAHRWHAQMRQAADMHTCATAKKSSPCI